jgi:hypothetical protein
MNQNGNLIIFVAIGFLVILILPFVVFQFFPVVRIIFQILAVFMIYATVRGYLGNNIVSIIVSAIFIYFLVFKYADIFASVWFLATLLTFGFGSVVMWGIGTKVRQM